MSVEKREVVLGSDDDGRRLDRIARKILPDLSLGAIFKALRQRDICVNGKRAKADTRVSAGDILQFRGPIVQQVRILTPADAAGDALIPDSRIIHENDHIIVINKAPGELAHGPDSLETLVQAHWSARASADVAAGSGEQTGVSFRPGPVHRLDRNTSGLIIYALSTAGAQEASRALQNRLIRKHYIAWISGSLSDATIWDTPLERNSSAKRTDASAEGQTAITEVAPLWSANGSTLALISLVTGRTHQIRAHAAGAGHPLVGDRKYGGGDGALVLHAIRLRATEQLPLLGFQELIAPLPSRAAGVLDQRFGTHWREALERQGLTEAVQRNDGTAAADRTDGGTAHTRTGPVY